MDAKFNNQRYVYGSEAPARQIDEPVRIPRRHKPLTKEELRRKQAERYAEENRRRAGRFGFIYTAFVTLAIAITMVSCISYVKVQNTRTNNVAVINSLKNELADLKEANDQKKLAIDSSINYDYIYKIATEELGMVHAGKDQVVKYQSGESEYVIQYSNISSK